MRAAHGELSAVIIGRIVTVNFSAAKLRKLLNRLHLLSIFVIFIFHDVPCRRACSASAIGKLCEAVLIVDIRRGDDGDSIFCSPPALQIFSDLERSTILKTEVIAAAYHRSQSIGNIAVIVFCNTCVRRKFAKFNICEGDTSFSKIFVNVTRCNYKRQTEVNNKGFRSRERVIQINYLVIIARKVCFCELVINVTILCVDLRHFLKFPVYGLFNVLNVFDRVIDKSKRILRACEACVKCSCLINGNVVGIERSRLTFNIVVNSKQIFHGLFCTNIICNQCAVLIVYLNAADVRVAADSAAAVR